MLHLVFPGDEHASLFYSHAPAAEMHAWVWQAQSQSHAQETEAASELHQIDLQIPLF